tara:strand:+ start:1160 stop:1600 length:441 start_codon:yes stop_codon:yes gene_type:complete
MPLYRRRLCNAALLVFAIAAVAGANVENTRSIGARNVAIPGFGKDGIRVWEMRASQALPLAGGIVDAKDLLLTTFSGPKVETVLQSPKARFHTEEGNASSDAPIQVNGPGYEISGNGWHWDANRSRIQIKANVKAVFNETFDNLFK